MRKTVVPVIASALAAPFFLLGTAAPASAATSCYASSCTGLVAADTTCVNDAEVVKQANIYYGSTIIGNIELKYSPSCRATWARVISDLSDGSTAAVESNNDTYLYENCYGADKAGTGCNTAMIDDANMTSSAYGGITDGYYFESTTTGSY
jgi:Protein of unknown function (DUF2690)